MSKTTTAISSQLTAILALGAVLTWMVCVPPEVRADPRPEMRRDLHSGHGGGKPDFAGRALHSLLQHKKDLGLTEDQSAQIKAIATDYTKTRIRDKAAAKLAEVDVRTLVRDEKADLSAIETAMKKAESARTGLRLDGVKAVRAATAVLTPEQREKWRGGMMERHRKTAGTGEYGREG